MIHHGDCLDVMPTLDAESIDAIVTDPPYGLEFMGKAWDSLGGQASSQRLSPAMDAATVGYYKGRGAARTNPTTMQRWHEAWATEALRVAKPGSYLLAFGGTRTVHRMTCAIEDAGWIIRDMLVWGYASGFPKGRANLKPAWEPIVMARKPGPLRPLAIDACRIPMSAEDAEVIANAGGFTQAGWQGPDTGIYNKSGDVTVGATVASGRWPANIVLTDPIFDGGWDGVVGGGETGPGGSGGGNGLGSHFGAGTIPGVEHRIGNPPLGDSGTYSRFFELPRGEGCYLCGRARSADESSGRPSASGASAPGPAPIGASRATDTTTDSPTTSGTEQTSWHDGSGSTSRNGPSPASLRAVRSLSSDPANNAARLGTSSGTTTTTPDRWTCDICAGLVMRSSTDEPGFAERPDAPRFLIIPKAARSDREPVLGGLPEREAAEATGMVGPPDLRMDHIQERRKRANVHPTVKPTDLMRHLVRLVTPPGGTVLDPFLGSGTTALAAEMEGFAWVGIEREAEYVRIAEARLNGTQKGMAL